MIYPLTYGHDFKAPCTGRIISVGSISYDGKENITILDKPVNINKGDDICISLKEGGYKVDLIKQDMGMSAEKSWTVNIKSDKSVVLSSLFGISLGIPLKMQADTEYKIVTNSKSIRIFCDGLLISEQDI